MLRSATGMSRGCNGRGTGVVRDGSGSAMGFLNEDWRFGVSLGLQDKDLANCDMKETKIERKPKFRRAKFEMPPGMARSFGTKMI